MTGRPVIKKATAQIKDGGSSNDDPYLRCRLITAYGH